MENQNKYIGILFVNQTIIVQRYAGLDLSSDRNIEEITNPFEAKDKKEAFIRAKKEFVV